MQKNLNKMNHLARWKNVLVCTAIFAMITLMIGMNFIFLRNSVTPAWSLRIFLLLIVIFLTLLICRNVIYYLGRGLNKAYFEHFTKIPSLATFKESASRRYTAKNKKHDHAVLLIHGFTSSPQQFEVLYPQLEALDLSYSAPDVLGFGLNSTSILEKVRCEDWCRYVLEQFDVLKMSAEHVSIVGHSMGGILAAFIAQHRQVKHLVLSAPGFYSVPKDLVYKKILFTPFLGKLFSWLVPYYPKSMQNGRKTVCDVLEDNDAVVTFQYLSVPMSAIKEIFRLQEAVNFNQLNFDTLNVLYGQQDQTIDNAQFIAALQKINKPYVAKNYETSAHNIFEDYDKLKVSALVVDILTQE